MEGKGRGGRGRGHLFEAIKKREVGGDEGKEEGEKSAEEGVPGAVRAPPVQGRGRFLAQPGTGRGIGPAPTVGQPQLPTPQAPPPPPPVQFRGDSPERASSSEPDDDAQSGENSSSGDGQPSPSGALGQSPPVSGMARVQLAEARGFPSEPDPIMNKARGQEGRQFNMSVNYIRVRVAPGKGIYAYEVKFEPHIESRKLRFEVLHKPECIDAIGSVMQFTGMNLYLPKLLPDGQVTTIRTTSPQNTPIDVTLKFIKEPPFRELVPFYNTLFRRIMQTLKMVEINRQFFNPGSRIEIRQHNLAIWSGVSTSLHDLDGGLLLNLDTSHRVLRTNTALEILKEIFMNPATKPNFKEIAEKKLVGCVVITKYNNRPYRIDGIDFQQNPQSTFQYADGRTLSYVEYFAEHWQQTIKDARQPLLIHRPKPRKGAPPEESRMISLIPELCFMTGLTDDIRSDFRAMKDIAEHTRIKPAIREEKLIQFLELVLRTPEARKHLTDWNIEMEGKPLKTSGRTFEPERILFGKNQQATSVKAEWSREATNNSLFIPIVLDKWLLVFTKRDAAKAEEFVKTLKMVSVKMGFTVKDPRRVDIDRDGPLEYTNAIKQAHSPGDQIVVVITPGSSQKEDRYNAIKRLCCSDISVPSQVVRANTLSDQKMRSVCQKIAIQMNCKMGGQPWAVAIPFKSVMILGIDVYHDPLEKSKSVVGVVASLNNTITRWYTRVSFQNTQTEIANCLESAFVACMKKFYLTNNMLPQRIFIYRDGVSDNQLNTVRDYEIVQIENALFDYAKSFKDYKPTLSVVVVQKRINTKMIMEGGGRLDNPPPGSVLDHTVTKRNFYDFFLVSQFVNQGTVTPTHYIVVHDKNEMPPDRMQKLSYKLTHLYYNWPGTIRAPACCQYAHKAAYLVGQNIRRTVSEELCDKLFYL